MDATSQLSAFFRHKKKCVICHGLGQIESCQVDDSSCYWLTCHQCNGRGYVKKRHQAAIYAGIFVIATVAAVLFVNLIWGESNGENYKMV